MPLLLKPITADDADACANIMLAAFEGPFNNSLVPNGYTKDTYAWERRDKERIIAQRGLNGVWKYGNKIVDTELPDDDPFNKIISYAVWTFIRHDQSETEMAGYEHAEHADGHPPDANVELWDAFFGGMARNRARVWRGKKHAELTVLVVHPNHQRRGAGRMQLDWGVAKADEDQLPAWLEATPEGRPLYESYGWKTVQQNDFDATKFGLPPMDMFDMRREAKHESKFQHFVEGVKRLGGGPGILSVPI